MRLNLAINYSGRAEIVDAVNALIQRARLEGTLSSLHIDEEASVRASLLAGLARSRSADPHVGEMRISNFLLWEIAYAELFVTETLWPDFDRAEFCTAILDYQKRDRRFGGLSAGADAKPEFALPDFDAPGFEADPGAASEEIVVSSQ